MSADTTIIVTLSSGTEFSIECDANQIEEITALLPHDAYWAAFTAE